MIRKKILHVDDDTDTLELVKYILGVEGYEVDCFTNAKEALKKIHSNPYDLYLLDIMMPEMSGWELFSEIQGVNKKPRVVFLTVLEIDDEKYKQMKEQGVRDYIKKPFEKKDLVKRIKKALS